MTMCLERCNSRIILVSAGFVSALSLATKDMKGKNEKEKTRLNALRHLNMLRMVLRKTAMDGTT